MSPKFGDMNNGLRCALIVGTLGLGCGAAVPDGEEGSAGSTQQPGDGTSEGGFDASTQGSSTNPGDSTTDASPASSSSTSSGGVVAETGSGSTTQMADTSTGVTPEPPLGTVPCGEEVCDLATEFCLGCSHPEGLDAHCLERTSDSLYDELGRDFRHGCTDGVNLFLECDDTEDCAEDELCRFVSGDFAFAVCEVGEGNTFGTACDDETQCSLEAPTCGPHDPLGYFTPFARVLGWTPQACQP